MSERGNPPCLSAACAEGPRRDPGARMGCARCLALVIGALLESARPWHDRLVGLVLAFGAGALISAVSFDLAQEGARLGDPGVLALGLGATAYFALNRMLARPRRRGNEAAADDDGGCWGRAPLSNTVPGGACASGLINEPSRSPRLAPRRDQARICPGILVIIGLVLFDAVAGTSPTGLDPILRLGRWLLRFPGVLLLVLVVVVLLITQPLFFMTLVLATLAVVIVLLLAAPEGQRIQVFRPRDGSLIALVGQVAERDPHYAYTIVGFEAGHEAPMTPGTAIAVTEVRGGVASRIDAIPRPDGLAASNPPTLKLTFDNDDRGRRAAAQFEQALRADDSTTISEGLVVSPSNLPALFRDQIGSPHPASLTLTPQPPPPWGIVCDASTDRGSASFPVVLRRARAESDERVLRMVGTRSGVTTRLECARWERRSGSASTSATT
jgi:hypothetical protein